jgi:hypothetical protein
MVLSGFSHGGAITCTRGRRQEKAGGGKAKQEEAATNNGRANHSATQPVLSIWVA